MLRMAPRSCCGWRLAWATLWGSQCSLFRGGLKSVGKVACILQDPLLLGVVGTPLLLQLMLCWLGCTWGCWLVASNVLLPQVFLLRLLSSASVSTVVALSALAQQIWVDVVLYAHVGFELVLPFFECCNSFHHMLVASASVLCVEASASVASSFAPIGVPMSWPVAILFLLRVPHTPLSWDQALFFFPSRAVCCWACFLLPLLLCSWSVVVLGCYPSAPCCCLLELT